jgi:integrase/recombinase XerD
MAASQSNRADAGPGLPPRLGAGLEDFLEALRVEAGLSRNTLRAYRGDLEAFLGWAAEGGLGDWAEVDAELVVDYLDRSRKEGLAEASTARRLSAIRMCLRHLCAEGVLARDPVARVAAPVLRRALPTTLTVEEVERLLGAPQGDDWRALRDRAFLEVLYACGARVAEAVALRTDAIEPSLRILVLTGKGRKTRVVPLGERARGALDLWLSDGRPELAGAARRPEVFLSRSGRPLDRTNAWRLVRRAALEAGLDATVSPHTLRHSFATHLIEGGADLRSVQEMLGHASIRTTEIYTHLDAEHVRSLHRLYHPRG